LVKIQQKNPAQGRVFISMQEIISGEQGSAVPALQAWLQAPVVAQEP
jgi:hypothetical protein